jgi:dihydroorotase
MVHLGGAPAPLAELLELLRPGDVVTHCYTPAGNGLVEGGAVIDAAHAARERGVLFDVGHGAGSFDSDIAEAAVAEQFWPDTISTDLHSVSLGLVVGMPTTMTKLLSLGMPLRDVVAASTCVPARIARAGDGVGTLAVGAPADIAVLEQADEETELADSSGKRRTFTQVLRARHTIRGGTPWYR